MKLPAAAAVLLAAAAVVNASEPKTYNVTIENMEFTPKALTVHPGDRVVWTNKDLFPHTVTADGKVFDSREIAANASWTYTAGKSGEYAYTCTLHTTMAGTLTVH